MRGRYSVLILLLSVYITVVSFSGLVLVRAEPRTIIVPDDYPTIGWAIGNASEGDTIFVKKGTYYETLQIDKSLSLMGEDKTTTIIDVGENETENVVKSTQDNVNMTGFTMQNARSSPLMPMGLAGILLINANYCNISGNIMTVNDYGIYVRSSSHNIIAENHILNNVNGIRLLDNSSHNIIVDNNITEQIYDGILLRNYCDYNTIVGNLIINNRDGIGVWTTSDFISIYGNIISSNNNAGILLSNLRNSSMVGNNITNNDIGIWLYTSSNIIEFYHNNFINNTIQVDTFPDNGNAWDNGVQGNYWDDYIGVDNNDDGIGDTPYIIDENNQDNYPLMYPVDIGLIPEFPSWTILPMLIVSTLVVIVVRTKIRKKGLE
ncbi:nitrous oxide reductase family maturation protein NosD [Thermoproteota archaeon]